MSREFIEKLEKYWEKHGKRPDTRVVELLSGNAVGWSPSKIYRYDKRYASELRKIERALLEIYLQENEPEGEWLEILRRPGVPLDMSDTLALSVISRWYTIDPMDRVVRLNLLIGIPMKRRQRPSEAGLNTPRIIIGRMLIIFIVILLLLACGVIVWSAITNLR